MLDSENCNTYIYCDYEYSLNIIDMYGLTFMNDYFSVIK